jgi:UDP-N-acetylglucosamine 2-epimerase
MKIFTVIGARPQFIKAAPVSKALKAAGHREFLVHTGQHYDYGMSQVFFDELSLPQPDVNLNIGSGNHGKQTGQMLMGIEEILLAEKPDCVLVYGDTNSTLAGALAAAKLYIPLAHVEAGLRSYNREMPEEHNRVLTDHCANLLFSPTQTGIDNLAKEGITRNVHLVGDTMYDAVLQYAEIAVQRSAVLDSFAIQSKRYLLLTIHRASNTDSADNLRGILSALAQTGETVIFPLHPRTRAAMSAMNLSMDDYPNIKVVDPQGYLDMLMLEKNARMILTDSGGIQKEAFFFAVPCVTLRTETEWVETAQSGWNQVVGIDRERILHALANTPPSSQPPALFGNGQAAQEIVNILGNNFLTLPTASGGGFIPE